MLSQGARSLDECRSSFRGPISIRSSGLGRHDEPNKPSSADCMTEIKR
jgi:hypothetical protein